MRIGITGTFSGGKDLVGNYLRDSLGLHHIPTGDLVREEAARRGIVWNRENLQKLGNILRAENGPGYLSQLALDKYPDDIAISGLRNTGEVRVGNFHLLISVDAPVDLRYRWAKKRGKLTDVVDLETFKRQELFEMGHEATGLQLGEVMAMAGLTIWNDKEDDFENIFRQVKSGLERFH